MSIIAEFNSPQATIRRNLPYIGTVIGHLALQKQIADKIRWAKRKRYPHHRLQAQLIEVEHVLWRHERRHPIPYEIGAWMYGLQTMIWG
ncbi:MAG: hypothetical protein ACOYL5_19395 [Phototrophicaceae bacterium]|jgi:hypothetical protein